jgi:glycosyltransferase involved in cell wall biosynthesis
MKVALVASSFPPEPGRLERRVDELARGLADRGADVEVLTQGTGQPALEQRDGATIRRYPTVVGPVRFPVAPKLRERLRLTSQTFDLIDVHTRQASLALAVASSRVHRLVLTPEVPIDLLLGWPYARATRAIIAAASQIVCRSETERDLLCNAVPRAAHRTRVIPYAVDAAALWAAEPFPIAESVVLSVDRLDRATGVGRAIAALPSLDPEFHLVVIGDGPARERLAAFAADLRISSRVQFIGAVSDGILYRWLRTARVVVALPSEHSSGSLLTEARAAGVSVVASDLPVHREAAQRFGGGHVIFVAPRGSPLDVADAIEEAARLPVVSDAGLIDGAAPSWESVIESTWELYGQLIDGADRSQRDHGGSEVVDLTAQLQQGRKARARALRPDKSPVEAQSTNGGSPSHGRQGFDGRVNGAHRWP